MSLKYEPASHAANKTTYLLLLLYYYQAFVAVVASARYCVTALDELAESPLLLSLQVAAVLNLITTTSQKCAVVLRRARI